VNLDLGCPLAGSSMQGRCGAITQVLGQMGRPKPENREALERSLDASEALAQLQRLSVVQRPEIVQGFIFFVFHRLDLEELTGRRTLAGIQRNGSDLVSLGTRSYTNRSLQRLFLAKILQRRSIRGQRSNRGLPKTNLFSSTQVGSDCTLPNVDCLTWSRSKSGKTIEISVACCVTRSALQLR
jgi:hypothetical protein